MVRSFERETMFSILLAVLFFPLAMKGLLRGGVYFGRFISLVGGVYGDFFL